MQPEKPIQSVEASQKFIAWNIKEISENMKSLDMVIKSVDESLKKLVQILTPIAKASQPQQYPPQQQPRRAPTPSEEIPF